MKQIDLCDIKKGQVFYECEYGMNIKLIATEDCKKLESGYSCETKRENGSTVNLFHAFNMEHYGPKLYDYPIYEESLNRKEK